MQHVPVVQAAGLERRAAMNDMERALGYLVQAQEDQRQAEELLTRAFAGRAMAMRLVKVSIERGERPHAGGRGAAARVRRFGDEAGEAGVA